MVWVRLVQLIFCESWI